MDNLLQQGGVVQQQQVAPQAGVQPTGQALFTQEQVNEIVSKRVNELNAEKVALTQSIEQYKGQLQKANEQITGYVEQASLSKAGIDPRFSSFLTFEARQLAQAGKTTFEEALTAIVQETGSLYLPQQVVQPTAETQGQSVNNEVNQVTPTTTQQSQAQPVFQQTPVTAQQPVQYYSSGAGSNGVLQSSQQSSEASFLQARLASKQGK